MKCDRIYRRASRITGIVAVWIRNCNFRRHYKKLKMHLKIIYPNQIIVNIVIQGTLVKAPF